MWYIICIMKDSLKNIFVYALIAYVASVMFSAGIILPEIPAYLLMTVLILSFTTMMACPFLGFLTIKCNLVTSWLMSSILLIGIFYVLQLFMVDFYIESFVFEGFSLGNVVINSFDVSPLLTMIFASVTCGFMSSLYMELDRN